MDSPNYPGNANKGRTPTSASAAKPEKKLEKVVVNEVKIKKKTLGEKFKNTFVNADAKSVLLYVITDVLVPAAQNMVVESVQTGIERLVRGESAVQRRRAGQMYGNRVVYNRPVNRTAGNRGMVNPGQAGRAASQGTELVRRGQNDDYILATKEEADAVLELMRQVIDQFNQVTVSDLNELVGFPLNPIDNDWGWVSLSGARVVTISQGFLLDLPPAQAL